jgi:hypothetical protein
VLLGGSESGRYFDGGMFASQDTLEQLVRMGVITCQDLAAAKEQLGHSLAYVLSAAISNISYHYTIALPVVRVGPGPYRRLPHVHAAYKHSYLRWPCAPMAPIGALIGNCKAERNPTMTYCIPVPLRVAVCETPTKRRLDLLVSTSKTTYDPLDFR